MAEKIRILNCNCIDEAEIEIERGTLNIKYGPNGTGKSTISKAIFAKATGNKKMLDELQPYGKEDLPDVQNFPFTVVRVFDESYVNSYLFQKNSFLENSYQVFLRSEDCEKLSKEISILLQTLQGIFQDSEEMKNLRTFLPKYFSAVNYKENTISKRGGVGELLKGNGGGFDKHEELKAYRPFYAGRDMGTVSKWAKWRGDGINHMNGESCPFCATSMEMDVINEQNEIFAKVFKSSALSVASAVLEYIEEGVEKSYIKEDSINALKSCIGDETRKDELFSELNSLAIETDYLYKKIEKICRFRPMNVTYEQLGEIEEYLNDLIIDKRQIDKFYSTELMLDLILQINGRITELSKNTGQLKGLFISYQRKIDKLIESRREDINHFFSIAGFPYQFVLKGKGEKKAVSYLAPVNLKEEDRVDNPEKHLSWGEKNAFSLVMFMFEALSANADLIVLDDPITSFDKNKKYAVIRRMFDNQKDSFRDKTVLMLTHDIQPIIDYVHKEFFKVLGLTTPVKSMYLQNEEGKLCEYEIEKTDILNTVELTKRIAEDDKQELAVRIVNLRKYVELMTKDFRGNPLYEMLSNIIHGRKLPTDNLGNKLDDGIISSGCEELQKYINGWEYDSIISELNDEQLVKLIKTDDLYVKVIAIRLLFERHEGLLTALRIKYPATCKFLNETNHVENDYIFQLDPTKYFGIPQCYMQQLEDFLLNDSGFIY